MYTYLCFYPWYGEAIALRDIYWMYHNGGWRLALQYDEVRTEFEARYGKRI